MKKTMRKLLALVLALCLTLGCTGMFASASQEWWKEYVDFTDLVDNPYEPPWYIYYLISAVREGFMSGTTKTTFSPNSPLTRAQAMTILARVHKKVTEETPTASGTAPFADVPADRWYAKTVAWAWEKGLVSGVAPDRFAPNKILTNGELAVIFNKYIRLVGKSGLYEPNPSKGGSSDIGWVKPHIEAISGFGIWWERFGSTETVDRAHAVELFVRLYDKLTYPVDNETPRQKFWYYVSPDDTEIDGQLVEFLPLGEERQKLFTSYEDYTAMVEGLWANTTKCRAVEQPAPLTIDETTFGEYNVLAIEKSRGVYGSYDGEIGNIQIAGDCAEITLTGKGRLSDVNEQTGVVFVVLVPKEVTHAEVTSLSWTDRDYMIP